MQRTIAAILLYLGLATAALAQSWPPPTTQASVIFSATQARTTLIAGKSGQRIYLTNIVMHPASTSVVTLTYGTGANCGTGTQVFYGPSTFQAGENVYAGNGGGAIFVVPAGNDVCLTIATATAPGWISYAQF